MTKQLLDLPKEEFDKVFRFSKKWGMNKTDTIKKMIRDFPEDIFNSFELGNGGLDINIW